MSSKSFNLTLVLCLVAGVCGLHRFYVGKYMSGVLQGATFIIPLILLINLIVRQFEVQSLEGLPMQELGLIGIALLANGIWVVFDLARIATSRFKDAKGHNLRQ